MTDSSRAQGGLICAGVVVVGLIFVLGVLSGSYWALAIPVAALVFFVLGLTFWVGWTIATIRVEPEPAQPTPASPAPAASTPNQKQA
jgi:ABC-type polysaccharide/polyol phosphate export permease